MTKKGSSKLENSEIKKEIINKESLIEKKLAIKELVNILSKVEQVDLLFSIDCTASMSPSINEVKNTITQIIDNLKASNSYINIRLGFLG